MKEQFTLESSDLDASLCTASESDCEDLRQWKNANRQYFFYQELISSEQQLAWFRGYLERPMDWMFIVRHRQRAIGCMGFRVLEDQHIDIYNVILGDPSLGGQGLMGHALQLMCSHIVSQFSSEVMAKVLNSNPAQDWYLRNGFRKGQVHETWTEFILDRDRFRPFAFRQENWFRVARE